jgi:hypothetical protein
MARDLTFASVHTLARTQARILRDNGTSSVMVGFDTKLASIFRPYGYATA